MSTSFPDPRYPQSSKKSLTNLEEKKPLGKILLEAGLVSIYQIEIALEEQKQYDLRIGEILANHGWIKQETADFFVDKWPNIIQNQQKRPLSYYLFAAAIIDKDQLFTLRHKQLQTNSDSLLHRLALEEGYVKQVTVDFFLKHLFNVNSIHNLSFTKPYELIKNYVNGKTNFQKLELSQVPLNGVRLKKVILDFSILRQANLKKSNLSYSSLVEVNLTLADLELANLSHVNFKRACLIEANLRKSNLEQANFQGANLQEADLRAANLKNASLISADLRGSKLDSEYSYDVFYNQYTMFSANFNPIKAGWKLKN